MKQAEYVGEVTNEGHLSLPENIRKQLDLKPSALVQIMISVPDSEQKNVQQAWDTFRQMGKDAIEGQLSDTSINHDQYLYGRKSQ